MEFSFRRSSSPDQWIPVRFIHNNNSQENNQIYIGNRSNLTIRGYQVEQQEAIPTDSSSSTANVSIELCVTDPNESIQFRWLQSSSVVRRETIPRDVWILDNLIVYNVINGTVCQPLQTEGFDTKLK